jgi:hypothetical protein
VQRSTTRPQPVRQLVRNHDSVHSNGHLYVTAAVSAEKDGRTRSYDARAFADSHGEASI